MNASELRSALAQTLENYQRCGVRRFPRATEADLPEGWLSLVDALTENAMAQPSPERIAQKTLPSQARNAVPAGEKVAASTSSGRPSQRQLTQGEPAELQPSELGGKPWSLPVLDGAMRASRLGELHAEVKACRLCPQIVDFRQQTVFGDGNVQPRVCFMGEAPGADEDRTGLPFVGAAGQLLTKILNAMQLKREEIYILNALKCRPPQNRTPVPTEIDSCRHFVERQLDTLQPEYLVCLGAVAVRSVLQTNDSIGQLRGKFHRYRGAKVLVTYHPSYLLRNESAKRLVWDDMKMLMADMAATADG